MRKQIAFALALSLALVSAPARSAESQPAKAPNIQKLKTSSNDPGGDYFLGSEAQLKPIIQSLLQDNSKLDAVYLYIAANTAFRLNMLPESGFLFYAAQIRKAFETKRFNLSSPDGNNVGTYLAFLNDTIGHKVNPTLMASPRDFSAAIDRLEPWDPVPAKDANYPKKDYGAYAVPEKDWPALASSIKEDFMANFGRKMKNFFKDPKNAEAFRTVQDFNFKKTPDTPENRKKYEAAMEILQKNGVQ